MEKAWKNIETRWAKLIGSLPTLLPLPGQYVYFGEEPDTTPYAIVRAKAGWRDCWIISENGEDSDAFLMECSRTTEGYAEDIRDFLSKTWCIDWNEPIYVSEKVYDDNILRWTIVKTAPGHAPETCRSFQGTIGDALTRLREAAFDRANSGHYGEYPLDMEAFNAKVEEGFSDGGLEWESGNGTTLRLVRQ